MNNKHHNLVELQNWLQSVTSEQAILEDGIRIANQSLSQSNHDLDSIVQPNSGINTYKRLSIYHEGYFIRLLQCMQAEFPKLCSAFSQEWFDQMALRYLATYPSTSKNLNDLGKNFPVFLESDRPDASSNEQNSAFDFIVSLATLERYISEVARGKGIESDDLSIFDHINSNLLGSTNITLAPSLRLMESKFDMCNYITSIKSIENYRPIERHQFIVISRVNFSLKINDLKEWQFDFLNMLRLSSSIQQIVDSLVIKHPNEPILGYLPIWFSQSVELGYFQIKKSEDL